MSTSPPMALDNNHQPQCTLLSLPSELRREIYGYVVAKETHVFLHGGRLHVSTCRTLNPSDDFFCFDRRSIGDPSAPVWARRLESSWGLHWRCEEVALDLDRGRVVDEEHDDTKALLMTCKRIFDDVAYFLAEKSVLHITDLPTLHRLQQANGQSQNKAFTDEALAAAFKTVKSLKLTLRLPISVYKSLESSSKCSSNVPAATTTIWTHTWTAISQLRRLSKLQIWIDHDSQSSWSLVNERAMLSPLTQLATTPGLAMTINMPSLLSRLTKPERHFPENEELNAPFNITRYLRQRFFCERRNDGGFGVVYDDDAHRLFSFPDNEEPTAEQRELEDIDRWSWLGGIDMAEVSISEPIALEIW